MFLLLRRRALASHSLRALRFADFRAWMAAGLVSVAGSWMQMVAQNWVMLQHTGSGAMVGLTLAAQAAPSLLLGMWAGGVVDRVDRRRYFIGTTIGETFFAALLALAVATGNGEPWLVTVLVFCGGVLQYRLLAITRPAS